MLSETEETLARKAPQRSNGVIEQKENVSKMPHNGARVRYHLNREHSFYCRRDIRQGRTIYGLIQWTEACIRTGRPRAYSRREGKLRLPGLRSGHFYGECLYRSGASQDL